jgi:hypothetical protein
MAVSMLRVQQVKTHLWLGDLHMVMRSAVVRLQALAAVQPLDSTPLVKRAVLDLGPPRAAPLAPLIVILDFLSKEMVQRPEFSMRPDRVVLARLKLSRSHDIDIVHKQSTLAVLSDRRASCVGRSVTMMSMIVQRRNKAQRKYISKYQ